MVVVALPLKSRQSHLLPRNPLSHTHTDEVQSPASEQSAFVSHPCTATAAPNKEQVANAATAIIMIVPRVCGL